MPRSRQQDGESVLPNVDLEQVFAASRSALCILRGPEHHWEKVNQVYQNLIFPGIDLIGRTVREVIPDADAQGFGALLDHVYATGHSHYGYEVPLRVTERPLMYVTFVYAPIHDTAGAVCGIFVEAHDVTTQVLTRHALEAAEANYRSIFDNAAEGIFRVSPEGRLLLVNRALAHILGYASPQEMLTQAANGVQHLGADSTVRSELAHMLANNDVVTGFVIKARHKDGSFLWLSVSIRILRDPDGSIREIEGIAEDITERHHAQEALRASEARYRTLFEHFPNGAVFLFDHELRYALARGTGLGKSELSPEMFEGKTIHQVFPQEIAARDEPYLRAALRGESTRIEVPLGDKTFLVHTLPVKDEHGSVVGGMVMTQDITERKRGEEHQGFLAAASASLGSSLEYDSIVQSIARLAVPILGDMCRVFIAEQGGAIHLVAISGTEHRSEEAAHVLPQLMIDGEGTHPVAIVIRTGETIIATLEHSLVVETIEPDEHRRVPHAHIVVPLVVRDDVRGAVMFGRNASDRAYDATERQLAEEFTRRAAMALDHARLYRDAQDALRTRDEFLSIAAHELKTPLTTLRGSAEVLQRRTRRAQTYTLTERDQQTLGVIVQQSVRLQQQIDTFLDLSQVSSGTFRLILEPLDLCQVVERVVREIRPSVERHQVTLTCEVTSPIVQGDQLRLDQVLQNLLQNAIKYSPNGGEVSVRITERGNEVGVAVKDQGIGIPVEAQAQLFERFYRVRNAANQGIQGLGIGLAVVSDIVSRHGGHVEVQSVEGEGSTFSVWLPRTDHVFSSALQREGEAGR